MNGTLRLIGALSESTDLIVAAGKTFDLQVSQTVASLDLDGTITNVAGTSSLTVLGTADIEGSITTTGTQDYEGPVTLTGDATLTTSSAQITFDDTVNSESGETNDLTVTASVLQFDDVVGGLRTLGDIDITAGTLNLNGTITAATSLIVSDIYNLNADVVTEGAQTYYGDVVISNNISMTSNNSDIIFYGTVDSANSTRRNLTINLNNAGADSITAEVIFGSESAHTIGETNPLGEIIITGNLDLNAALVDATSISVSGTSNLGGNVTTSGTQSYSGAVTVSANIILATTDSDVIFGDTIDNVTVNSVPTVVFYDNTNFTGQLYTYTGTLTAAQVGSSCNLCSVNDRIESLTLTAGGYLTLYQHGGRGGWSQLFDNRSGATTASYALPYGSAQRNDASSFILSGGGAGENYDLSLVTGSGSVSVTGSIGATNKLDVLTLNNTGTLTLSDAVTVNTLTLTHTGGTTVGGTVTATTINLTDTSDAASIAFNGNVSATTLNTAAEAYNVILNGTTSTITNAVTFSNSGYVTFGNGTGDTTTFTGGVTAAAPSQVNLAGTIQTTNTAISLGDAGTPIVLTANTILSGNTAGAITLGGTVNGAYSLTVNTTGDNTFSRAVGNTTALTTLTTNASGTTYINGGAITTSSTQTYNDAVVLGADTTLTTTDSNITLGSTVDGDGTARDLTIDMDNSGVRCRWYCSICQTRWVQIIV